MEEEEAAAVEAIADEVDAPIVDTSADEATVEEALAELKNLKERMANACKAVHDQNVPIRQAARQFGVSSTTLHRHLKNPTVKPRGKPCKFTEAENEAIAQLLLRFADVGGSLSKNLIKKVVIAVGTAKGLDEARNKFSNMWQRRFLERFPAVAVRFSRKKAREWDAEKWNELMEALEREGILEDPRGVFAFSTELVHNSVQHASRPRPPGTKRLTTPKASAVKVPRIPKDRFAAQKKAMKTSLKEIWGDDLADVDVNRLVAEADLMARGVIPSGRHIHGPSKEAAV
ncbi:hypothetical protein BV898_05353 [Hypsibius exemplaris]|uniref:HTH psq-type domain-containing protein n=1 Tax=Hypsibius exemplaris TaxID=2072580 RepID=A0A1W0WZX9_HYPEX|nr:hypothetical protein BV898_05353 [Hypsibius exemplaris]